MPYIITTKPRFYSDPLTERAVATLEEAQIRLTRIVSDSGRMAGSRDYHEIQALDWRDGPVTIGPLPDGTVIEVRQASWEALHAQNVNAGRFNGTGNPPPSLVLAAYNAR